MPEPGISTRAVVAATAEPVAGQPFLAGPVFASAYHLPVPEDDSLDTYGVPPIPVGGNGNRVWRRWSRPP